MVLVNVQKRIYKHFTNGSGSNPRRSAHIMPGCDAHENEHVGNNLVLTYYFVIYSKRFDGRCHLALTLTYARNSSLSDESLWEVVNNCLGPCWIH